MKGLDEQELDKRMENVDRLKTNRDEKSKLKWLTDGDSNSTYFHRFYETLKIVFIQSFDRFYSNDRLIRGSNAFSVALVHKNDNP
ncbi:hypothetical protein CR513_12842, partial [Mucuna pruriens]